MTFRALFVGGVIDNNEIDMDVGEPPLNYPPETGNGVSRYRLQAIGKHDDTVACAVYGAPGLDPDEVLRVSDERAYARRFHAELTPTG
ncbi:hypothetical protein E2F46_11225 [Luteimonas aestuarii]|uniref:Uncharacterized protein n=1 Tax=Luteimonas aestuarii TaxID=453837 RepID=A0A4R5TKX8_9GAMM|nr:hypothetical protein [Luteimonas aestuarii]TDK23186.1 hypothetical protein E2F46_11225 [Luteimonas aestuarii]